MPFQTALPPKIPPLHITYTHTPASQASPPGAPTLAPSVVSPSSRSEAKSSVRTASPRRHHHLRGRVGSGVFMCFSSGNSVKTMVSCRAFLDVLLIFLKCCHVCVFNSSWERPALWIILGCYRSLYKVREVFRFLLMLWFFTKVQVQGMGLSRPGVSWFWGGGGFAFCGMATIIPDTYICLFEEHNSLSGGQVVVCVMVIYRQIMSLQTQIANVQGSCVTARYGRKFADCCLLGEHPVPDTPLRMSKAQQKTMKPLTSKDDKFPQITVVLRIVLIESLAP